MTLFPMGCGPGLGIPALFHDYLNLQIQLNLVANEPTNYNIEQLEYFPMYQSSFANRQKLINL